MAHIFCFLALLCFASCAVESTETAQDFKDLQLQQHSLSWFKKLQDKQESTKIRIFLDLLYEILKIGNTVQEQRDTEKQEKKRRGLGRGSATRKTSCRVFFWKSWASC
ncbi:somatostatin-1A-like [Scophthalmus maximus]|uniref:Somatostatin/Cortistatin C-terminal domain-containing protein n=1 Tax=Scophthalmus maximus TaxID=52904 RepID=A0A8D3DSC8_SCOMX|nr:somatostatin-1A-like [Scophthalmus maximus]